MGVLLKRAEDAAAADLTAKVVSYALGIDPEGIVDDARGRYASVYKDFSEASDFADFIEESDKSPKRG